MRTAGSRTLAAAFALGLVAACKAPATSPRKEEKKKEESSVKETERKEPAAKRPTEARPRSSVFQGRLRRFAGTGAPEVREPFLDPPRAWTQLLSRITASRADSAALDKEILISFEPGAVHQTRAGGRRTTWRLPPGLVLEGPRAHLLLRPDLSLEVLDSRGRPRKGKEETLCRARVRGEAGVRKIRLLVQDGQRVRSIETAG